MSDMKLLRVSDVAKIFGISVETVRRWENNGVLVPIRLPSRQRRYRPADVEALAKKWELISLILRL